MICKKNDLFSSQINRFSDMPPLPSAIQIHIADDHIIFRDGLCHMIRSLQDEGIQFAGESANGAVLLQQLERSQPDIILMDIQMPLLDGIRATARIKQLYPRISVLALSSFDDLYMITEMIEAGAKGYLLKNVGKEELVQAVKRVYAGETYYTPTIAARLDNRHMEGDEEEKVQELTPREKDVVRLICQGLTNKEIASAMLISRRTVEGHREKIMLKVKARHSADIVTYAMKYGLHRL
jgi:two-component system response regulator NreC